MSLLPWDCTILGTRFVLEDIPSAMGSGLGLLLQAFAAPPSGPSPTRTVRVRVRSPACRSGGGSGFLEVLGTGDLEEHRPLSFLDPREVELGLVRCAMDLAPEFLVLHAAALERDGHTVLVMGESGAGKTTLSLLLRREGWTLLSDDLAPLHLPTGSLIPFPRVLHLDGEYPPASLVGLPAIPDGFPEGYAPFPLSDRSERPHASTHNLPVGLLCLRRPADRERGSGWGGDDPRHRSSSASSEEMRCVGAAEAFQSLHRSVIRTRNLDLGRALPFLIQMAQSLRGFEIGGSTPEATRDLALRALVRLPGPEVPLPVIGGPPSLP